MNISKKQTNIFETSIFFPVVPGSPWGTLGGPRIFFWIFSKILDVFFRNFPGFSTTTTTTTSTTTTTTATTTTTTTSNTTTSNTSNTTIAAARK